MNSSFYCSLRVFLPQVRILRVCYCYITGGEELDYDCSLYLKCLIAKIVPNLNLSPRCKSCTHLTDRLATNYIYSSVRVMTVRANKLKNERTLTCCVFPLMPDFPYIHVLFNRTTEKRGQTSTAWSR